MKSLQRNKCSTVSVPDHYDLIRMDNRLNIRFSSAPNLKLLKNISMKPEENLINNEMHSSTKRVSFTLYNDCGDNTQIRKVSSSSYLRPNDVQMTLDRIPAIENYLWTLKSVRNPKLSSQPTIRVLMRGVCEVAGFGIVLLSALVCVITAISISGICSNGESQKGGLYYVISRSLGPEFGGSIGAIFAIANAMMASLYVVSAAETIADLMNDSGYETVTNTKINDVRLFGIVICIILMLITFAGPDIEQSATLFMFSLYHLSFIDWCLGSILPPSDAQKLRGMTGYSMATISENWLPAWRNENFISVFAILFPGMTGLMAGSMFISDLRDQARDVPLGMFTAIGVCVLYNLIAVLIPACTMLRDVSGDTIPLFDNVTLKWKVAKLESAWGPLLIAGIFAMSLSSTMTNLDNGPLIFQVKYSFSICRTNEPEDMQCAKIGDLNVINGFVSNLFLAAYASVNYACFDASFAKAPGFRPSFRYYNMWLSLAGAGLCIIVMFIISWTFALLIFAFFLMILFYLSKKHLDVNWGSSTSAVRYRIILSNLLKMSNDVEHVKNYRPQILLLTGNPAARPSLLDFAVSITKGESLLIAAHVVQYEPNWQTFCIVHQLYKQMTLWLSKNKFKAFYSPFADPSLRSGAQHLLQMAGIGRLRPNILMMGFKNNWFQSISDELLKSDDYVDIIRDALENNFGVGILRNDGSGFDISERLLNLDSSDILALNIFNHNSQQNHSSNRSFVDSVSASGNGFRLKQNDINDLDHSSSQHNCLSNEDKQLHVHSGQLLNLSGHEIYSDSVTRINALPGHVFYFLKNHAHYKASLVAIYCIHLFVCDGCRSSDSTKQQVELTHDMLKFHLRIKKGRIDVWWLYDDGGLTLLVPHLLRLPKSYLENAELRVFTLASSYACCQTAAKKMAALLSKFRIPFTDVCVIADITQKPSDSTLREFEAIIAPMRMTEDKASLDRDILYQVSYPKKNLSFRTLPIPRLEINTYLYMAWLDLMTRNLPPVLMIRGNQTSVLTFYS
ncbi:unnamed protein product [Thelazia callipaeda]|uniref:Solute carrier family 12 member 2 n=1 Tax=Thelazia callipaeda TaxID=103827 RepID=A0A158RAU9_THECL|nr:unnamed protein product [Thelazia callipaeda]